MLFIGQYSLKLDRKGKIALPDTFTKTLEQQNFQGLYFFPSLCGRYLDAASETWMANLSKYLENQGAFDGLEHEKIYLIFDQVVSAPLEKNGRITIPETFLKLFSARGQVTIVGYGYRFGVWSSLNYQSYINTVKPKQKATLEVTKDEHINDLKDMDKKNEQNSKNNTEASSDNALLSADDSHAPSTVISQKKKGRKLLNLKNYKARSKIRSFDNSQR